MKLNSAALTTSYNRPPKSYSTYAACSGVNSKKLIPRKLPLLAANNG
jgi:hypothetical protein